MKILVTGASGQLGSTFKSLVKKGYAKELDFVFKSATDLDITDIDAVQKELTSSDYAYCINCAGFTNVDSAEDQKDLAYLLNVTGVRNLAINCNRSKTILIHISTDFVFDGFSSVPYSEEAVARPINFYGDTKYKGERAVINNVSRYFILRTSWLYSEFGQNFMKTMLKLAPKKDSISVVYDQIGTPTYALDLANTILLIIKENSKDYGTYNYSNEGVASWYDFAKAIFEGYTIDIELKPILSTAYEMSAERPKFSVLDKSKIKDTFGLIIPHWKDSLTVALRSYSQING